MIARLAILALVVGGVFFAATARDTPKPVREHPDVAAIAVERRSVKTDIQRSPPREQQSVTYVVTLRQPVDWSTVDEIAAGVRRLEFNSAIVGVRFVFADYPRALDPEAGQPYYAWKLFWPGRDDISNFSGVTPNAATEIARSIKPRDGESIVGLWVDHYWPFGVFALLRDANGGHSLIHGMDVAQRWRLAPEKGRSSGQRYRALEVIHADGARYKTDGVGADSLAILITAEGQLQIFGGRYTLANLPYIRANRFHAAIGR